MSGYIAYDTDFINQEVAEAKANDSSNTRPTILLKTVTSLRDDLISGTYKLVFTLYDKSEVEKTIETTNSDGTITSETKTVTEYQRIGETYSYIVIK